MQRRNKVGGILDRRIGENDPTMTPEEKMLQRFTREKQRRKGASLFDLEEADDDVQLTHLGQSLELDGDALPVDDFDDDDIPMSGSEEDGERISRKRPRDLDATGDDDDEKDHPERKKTKAEVMKEVMAKSKLHKYERQQAKEEDEDIREELDKELPEILAVLRNNPNILRSTTTPATSKDHNQFSINPDRAALLNGKERSQADKEYDSRLRQMALDQRSKPSDRTQTEEEKAAAEAERLKRLEEQRLRRMRGEEASDEEDDSAGIAKPSDGQEEPEANDAAEFGLGMVQAPRKPLDVEDEDDFVIDEDLVNSASDVDTELTDMSDEESAQNDNEKTDADEYDDFLQEVTQDVDKDQGRVSEAQGKSVNGSLAYTYPCPSSHKELLSVFENVSAAEQPVVIQRIRALYHPQLHEENKAKLADFSVALVDHIAYLGTLKTTAPLSVIGTIIRHIHSLSRTFALGIAKAFRAHLDTLRELKQISPSHLVLLTAISTIYPTSDHFHPVVTPAMTLMARWLGMTTPSGEQELVFGAYIGALCIKYQRLSKRYIPELLRFTLLALKSKPRQDLQDSHVENLLAMADLWAGKSAFTEIFSPNALSILKDLGCTKAHQKLHIMLDQARLRRRPLELHHHRPLAIKTSIPKFEESYNPDKHYDPDRERAEASKLRAEYRRERKGALRELRKDANFIAREQLREKKEADKAYNAKFKRLVAEIQGEEGKEKNAYERVKRLRKAKR